MAKASADKPTNQDDSKLAETAKRSAGQDPDPQVQPNPHESQETPSATATPPQSVQTDKSNAAQPAKAGKRYKVRVLRGVHMEQGKTYSVGDIVESETDLVGRFGTEKFESVDAPKVKHDDSDDD